LVLRCKDLEWKSLPRLPFAAKYCICQLNVDSGSCGMWRILGNWWKLDSIGIMYCKNDHMRRDRGQLHSSTRLLVGGYIGCSFPSKHFNGGYHGRPGAVLKQCSNDFIATMSDARSCIYMLRHTRITLNLLPDSSYWWHVPINLLI
jgi:hypothetical protein